MQISLLLCSSTLFISESKLQFRRDYKMGSDSGALKEQE